MKAVTLNELYQARAEQSDSAFRPAALALCNWFEELLGLLFPQRAVRSYRDAADVGEHAGTLVERSRFNSGRHTLQEVALCHQ